MKKIKPHILNLFLIISCIGTMSFMEESLEPTTRRRLLGWSSMACVPSGENAIELHCRQCYYVLFIAFDCVDCINYVGASNNSDCVN
jgi:hypothetical protein